MDAPPPEEDCRLFVRVAGYLEAMQINAPRIIEADIDKGFLLITDLGSEQYLHRLQQQQHQAELLYNDAITALLAMQCSGVAYQSSLPPYDERLLRFELSLFRDWLCGTHLNLIFSNADEAAWGTCCDLLVANALHQPQVFVHRDYHSRNLMVSRQENPGVLDFQDAVEGPFTYDLVSLLKDCYVRNDSGQVRQWALNFYAQLDQETRRLVDEPRFLQYFELMGIQRHLKAAGIFCRLNHRDGKSGYLADVPRTLEYIVELNGSYPELGFLMRLIEEQILPSWEDTQ